MDQQISLDFHDVHRLGAPSIGCHTWPTLYFSEGNQLKTRHLLQAIADVRVVQLCGASYWQR